MVTFRGLEGNVEGEICMGEEHEFYLFFWHFMVFPNGESLDFFMGGR